MKTASWVISERTTGRAIFETFSAETADKVRRLDSDLYDVTPIYDWLVSLNQDTNPANAMRANYPVFPQP